MFEEHTFWLTASLDVLKPLVLEYMVSDINSSPDALQDKIALQIMMEVHQEESLNFDLLHVTALSASFV